MEFATGLSARASNLVIHAGDLAVLAGYTYTSNGDRDFALIRVSVCDPFPCPFGSPDPTFGANGRVQTDFGGLVDDAAEAITIPQSGKLLVAGYSMVSGSADFALAQYIATTPVDLSSFTIE